MFSIEGISVIDPIAKLLGETCPYKEEDLRKVKEAFQTQFYDPESNSYIGGIQGANCFALDIDLGNPEMAASVAAYYHKQPAFDTGFLGTGILIRQLFKQGYGDVAIKLLKSEAPGQSYGWQRMQGATTLWERWNGYESHNPPMFGSPIQWLFEGLLGIQAQEELTIQPLFTEELEWAEGQAETAFGNVSINWKRTEQGIILELNIPCEANIILPKESVQLTAGAHRLEMK